MNTTKLAVICQIYNESENGNLRRFFYSLTEYADVLVLYNDGSTDDSLEVLAQFNSHNTKLADEGLSRLKKIKLIHSYKNDFSEEIFHKDEMLKSAIKSGATHIMWLDADECVQQDRLKDIRLLCESMGTEIDAYCFRQVNLWRSDRYYRLDNQYGDGQFTRLWRNNGLLNYKPEKGLHHRQYPDGIKIVKDTDIKIIHWGFASDESILNKYEVYKSHGQDGWALNRLVDENNLVLAKTKPEWLPNIFNGRTIDQIDRKLVDLL